MVRTIRLAWGTARRFYLTHFRRKYVQEQAHRRRGECARCGKCCKIVMPCAFLKDRNHCRIYGSHPNQCRAFPVDYRDLKDVPECRFWFSPNGQDGPECVPGAADDARNPAEGHVAQDVPQSSSREVP